MEVGRKMCHRPSTKSLTPLRPQYLAEDAVLGSQFVTSYRFIFASFDSISSISLFAIVILRKYRLKLFDLLLDIR